MLARGTATGTPVQRWISGSWQACVDRVDVASAGRSERDRRRRSHAVARQSATISPLVRALFWISAALIVWTQALYAPALALLRRLEGLAADGAAGRLRRRRVSLVVAAYNEEAVIAAKVAQRAARSTGRASGSR